MAWYVTKYALSNGILELPDEQCRLDGSYLWWSKPGCQSQQILGKSEFCQTKAEAKAKAISMAQKKIKSSQKAIAKMEKLIAEWEGDQ